MFYQEIGKQRFQWFIIGFNGDNSDSVRNASTHIISLKKSQISVLRFFCRDFTYFFQFVGANKTVLILAYPKDLAKSTSDGKNKQSRRNSRRNLKNICNSKTRKYSLREKSIFVRVISDETMVSL